MGKKKSVVLITLISIVVAILCAITLFPSFEIPFRIDGTYKSWNPVVKQFDLSADLGGGYYTYYYPEGVIPASEYESNYENQTTEEDKQAYADKYVKHGGLYLEKAEASIFDDEETASKKTISSTFKSEFKKATKLIVARFEDKGYSASRVAVVDDYALRVELPASEVNYASAFASYMNVGEITMQKGGADLEQLEEKEVSDFIKNFKVGMRNKAVYVEVKLTKEGKELIKDIKGDLTAASAGSESATTLDILVGGEKILQIYSDYISNKNEIMLGTDDLTYADMFDTWGVLLNSALKDGSSEIVFQNVSSQSIRTFEPAFGENTLTLLYIALGVLILACLVLPIVFYRGYGVASAYSTLSYLAVVAICFAFITDKIFEVTLGSVLVFALGLLLVNFFNVKIYAAIKEGVNRKTVESCTKDGYKKTMAGIIDVYAVLVAGALIFLTAVSGVYTLAIQALICFITGAFCNLLWGRLINFLYMNAAKDKYKYFHFVREEDDDDE